MWESAVKSKVKALRHFKVDPVLKIDATFHCSLDLGAFFEGYSTPLPISMMDFKHLTKKLSWGKILNLDWTVDIDLQDELCTANNLGVIGSAVLLGLNTNQQTK